MDERILAIDIGAGTQDILVHDPARTPENQFRLVMPSQTQVVAGRIRAVTAARSPLHLDGVVMGGGASTTAIAEHVAAGLPVTATESAAKTVHNRPERVAAAGVQIAEVAPDDAVTVTLGDIDLPALETALDAFGVSMPSGFAFAAQDHGVATGRGNNGVRGDYLHWLVREARTLERAAFAEAPAGMTRLQAIAEAVPGCVLMDTGAAALLGALDDSVIAERADEGVVLVNIGNMHTFAALLFGRRIVGVLEHHTGGMNRELLVELVRRLQELNLTNEEFRRRYDGHGAVLAEDIDPAADFGFVAITGPNRGMAAGLGWYGAAPHGDMMLTGSYGLVAGYRAAKAG
jgi:uncharacterized protein (DUF1786 family)